MTRETAINKLIASMYTEGIISIENDERIRIYLGWMWDAGGDSRATDLVAHNKKKVIQYDMQGKVLGRYESVVEASKELGIVSSTIYESIWYDRPTKRGHIWKYAENGKSKNNR